jgi:superfamily II DNA or RNA helicase
VGTLADLLERLHSDAGVRGKQFEHITKWFLTNSPLYRNALRRVWLWDEWPGRWGPDAGIDLVAEGHDGRLWAIQAKAYDPAYSVTKADVDTFLSESARPEFAFRLLIATTDRIGKTAERTLQAQEKPASRLLLADLRAAQLSWPRFPSDLRAAKPPPKRPRAYQREAITAVARGFELADRGQMIMACGTGKTLTALFIAQRLAAKRTLVLVPSLSLQADTLREWTANDEDFEFLPVCSDETVSGTDAAVSSTTDLGFPVTTDAQDIAVFLRRRSGSRRVVFATYQSSPKIAKAFGLGRVPGFDLVIADEAHRCAGHVSSDFATVLDPDAIPAKRRLFMTATPRFFTGRVVQEAREAEFEVASMDDESHFGPVFHRLGFAEAIERELLTDYQVVVVGVDDATYLDWAQRGRFVTIDGTKVTDARTLAGQIGLAKAMRRYDLRRTISFHSRVSAARQFASSMPELIDWMPAHQRPKGQLWSHYASGEMTAGDRSALLDRLRHLDSHERGLLANARCLGEGIDVPTLDGVAFIDPRRSEVDIVQAVGRSIRLAEDKNVGTIVIPVFIEAADDPEAALDASVFKPVWDVVRALRAHDDQLGGELDELRRELGRGICNIRLPSKLRLDLPARVNPNFASAFDVRLVEATTRNWQFSLGVLKGYVEREGTSNVPQSWTEKGYRLGQWVASIRVRYATGKFKDPVRIADLEALPGWSWTPRDDRWECGYSRLCDFVDREGHAQVPRGHLENGFALGRWVTKQRHASRRLPNDEHHQRLAGLPGWTWEPYDDRWESAYRLLKDFGDAEGHYDVPQSYSIDGTRLGAWVGQQRLKHRQGQLSQDRSERLEALPGWTWNAVADRWKKGYRLLQAFVRQQGHARVPVECRVDDYPLGYWVRTQRAFYTDGRLSPSRISRLEALCGWTWTPFADQWEQGFSVLLSYIALVGNSRVPAGHVEGAFNLGNWVGNQRSFYRRGKLSPEHVSRLEALPEWAWTLSKGPSPRSNVVN